MSYIGVMQRVMATIPPWFLRQRFVGTFLESVGLTLDSAVESFAQGVRGSQPFRCDESFLPILSRDRGIFLYPTESTPSKRLRLAQWWQLHRQRGTHQGEMRHLQPYFLPGAAPTIRIVHQDGNGDRATWHTLSPTGVYSIHKQEPSNWNFDDHPEWWSRWWAIIYTSGTVLDTITHWDDGSTWDGGSYWDGVSRAVLDDIVAMLVDWKAAHSQCAGVILARDPASFDPTATAVTLPDGSTSLPAGGWGRLIDPTTGQPTRLQTATFIYDRYR